MYALATFQPHMATTYGVTALQSSNNRKIDFRLRPIMPKFLPIMLLSIAQKLSLLCSKLCFQNQDYALELTVLLEYINLS